MTTRKTLVCACEDVTESELREAIAHGCADVESLKRYTGFATGPCQGKACLVLCRRVLADATGADEGALGSITFRPPVVPIPLSALAGEEDGST